MLSSAQHGRTQGDIKRFIPPTKLPKLDLATDVEHVVNLVNQYVAVNVQQCSLSHGYMLYLAYRHFFYWYDRLKYMPNLYTPKMKSWIRHWCLTRSAGSCRRCWHTQGLKCARAAAIVCCWLPRQQKCRRSEQLTRPIVPVIGPSLPSCWSACRRLYFVYFHCRADYRPTGNRLTDYCRQSGAYSWQIKAQLRLWSRRGQLICVWSKLWSDQLLLRLLARSRDHRSKWVSHAQLVSLSCLSYERCISIKKWYYKPMRTYWSGLKKPGPIGLKCGHARAGF